MFAEQLTDLGKILNENNSTEFDKVRNAVATVTKKIEDEPKFAAANIAYESLQSCKEWIENDLSATKKHFEEIKKKEKVAGIKENEKYIAESMEAIEQMQTLLKVTANVGLDMYKQNRDDDAKLDEINAEIESYQDQINTWKQYEETIKMIMLPQLIEIQTSFDEATTNLSAKSHVQLDITKWEIQSALGDLKKFVIEMAKAQESLLEGDLRHCIEKIVEGITVMITVYDRIDAYTEQSNLAELISNVAIGSTGVKDPRLEEAMFNLDKIVKTNLVLERFESLMQAVKQHKFPYAQRYLDKFNKFPTDLQSNDTKLVIETVTANINSLQGELQSSESTLELVDTHMFSNHSFDSSQPFYTWHYQDFDIQQLLNGDQVTLKSDISKGLHFSSVKLKEISINLKLENQWRQKELDAELEKLEIVMTMVGNNYYRCNNRIYYISMEKDVMLIFRMRNGNVVGKNNIYQKISTSDYFLSPYTVWNILLRSSDDNFNGLKSFKDENIDLQLTGSGQFITDDVLGVCSSDLDNYYSFVGIDDNW